MNRAFIYGDLLFETIKVVDGIPQLFVLHYNRLMQSAALLNFETTLTSNQFYDAIVEAVLQQKIKSARVRFVMHRNAEGFYTPQSNSTQFFIEVFPLNDIKNNIKLGVYPDNYKSCTNLSSVKSGNALLYVMAGIWALNNNVDDAIILNEFGRVCEAVSSNIFIVKNNIVYTPSLSEGCVEGVMRSHIIAQLLQANYEVQQTIISIEQVQQADAVFLTNAIQGIVKVASLGPVLFTQQFEFVY